MRFYALLTVSSKSRTLTVESGVKVKRALGITGIVVRVLGARLR